MEQRKQSDACISYAESRQRSTEGKMLICRLLLVRHGETVDNVNKIMQGQTDGCLTLNGIEQARQLGRQLRGEHIDVFLSSDLARAKETLRIIMEETHPLTPPVREGSEKPSLDCESYTERVSTPLPKGRGRGVGHLLRERDWGSFTGRYSPDLQNEVWPDDIETLGQMKDRARRFLDLVRKQYAGKTVLAVGHGIMNKAIQSVYSGRPMNEIQKMGNCEVRVLEL